MDDDFGVQFFGSNGGARIFSKKYADVDTLDLFSGSRRHDHRYPSRASCRRPGHEQIIRGFVDGILLGTPVSPDGEEGLDRVRLIDAIYKSAELGREISIDEVG